MDHLESKGTAAPWPIPSQVWLVFVPTFPKPAKKMIEVTLLLFLLFTACTSFLMYIYQFKEWPHHTVDSLVRDY